MENDDLLSGIISGVLLSLFVFLGFTVFNLVRDVDAIKSDIRILDGRTKLA